MKVAGSGEEHPSSPPKGRRRGRPRKTARERRAHRVPLNLTEDEVEILDRHRGDLSRQDYLRLIATRGRRPTLPVPEVRRTEFVRLYQLERSLERMWLQISQGEGRLRPHADDLRDQIAEVHREVLRLRRMLLGLDP